jgi:RNA polymerase sigma-70 factor (ECF subfamily)
LLKTYIQKAKQGDADAFGVIYNELYTPLYRYLYSRTRHKEQTEDLCQQAFIRFYEALPRYEYREDDGSLFAYLFTIAKRLMINDAVKKQSVTVDEDVFESLEDSTVDTLQEVYIQHLASRIEDYIPLLTETEQDVIRLIYFSELSHKETALILEKEEAYVRKLKERALAKLRTHTKHLHENL